MLMMNSTAREDDVNDDELACYFENEVDENADDDDVSRLNLFGLMVLPE